MPKGSLAKEEITSKILETFNESFINNKEIRIPWIENGEEIQIKVTLTTAKENIIRNADVGNEEISAAARENTEPAAATPSEEEKQKVADLIAKLGL